MRFVDLQVGESFALDDGTSPVHRVILRKLAAGLAQNDRGELLPLAEGTPVVALGRHRLDECVSARDNSGESWRLVLRWTQEEQRHWQSVDEADAPLDQAGERRFLGQFASALHGDGRFLEAIEVYDGLLGERPEAALLNNRGAALMALGRAEEAVGDYSQAIDLDPSLPQAFSNRGNALTKLGRYPEALEDYDRALELDDSLAAVYCNRGLTRRLQGAGDSGLSDFDQAVEADPDFGPGYLARGGARALLGDVAGAIVDLERYLELHPDGEQAPQARLAVERLRGSLGERSSRAQQLEL